MNISNLSDQSLLTKTRSLVREESRVTTEILHHLREIESRKLFASLGYSSLFDYAVKDLGYSESSAQRRIASMRLLKVLPQVEEKIKSGELSLSVVAQAQSYFRQEENSGNKFSVGEKEKVLKILEGKTSREAEKALLGLSSSPEKHRPDQIRPLTETSSRVSFVVDDETVKDLEQLKGLLAHQHPDLSLGELIGLLAKRALKDLDPAKKEVKRLVSASEVGSAQESKSQAARKPIPLAVKRAVWRRDGSCCTYTHEGKRCGSRYQVEIDHIHGLEKGNDPENLRLLCRQHNQWAASQVHGRDHMQQFWQI
jgi:hypothetical protein